MKIPEIPTDNLYKFMALCGVVILIASFFPTFHMHKLNMQMIELAGEKAMLKVQVDCLVENFDKSRKEGQELSKKVQQLIDENDYRKATKISMKEMEDLNISISNITEEIGSLHEPLEKIHIAIYKVKFKQLEVNYLRMVIRNIGILIFLGRLLGLTLMFFGFWFWYKKLQAPLDKLITIQHLNKSNK